jgi:REP element-mobilizing transposase RayT
MLQRKRTRLLGFDYAQPGAYFVTTVAQDRRCVFGEVKSGVILLFGYGEILVDRWHWLHQQYSYLTLDAFIVMPNHFHAIININTDPGRAGRDRPLQQTIKPVSELIGAFKTTTSKRIHQSGMTSFQWQRSFYDRIIRNDKECDRIREYIQTNPYGGNSI